VGNRQVFVLGIIAFLVATVSGLAWYHKEFYDNYRATSSATTTDMENKSENTQDSSTKESKGSTETDLSSFLAKLQIPEAKREKVASLVQDLNKEAETTSQSIQELLQQNLQQPSDIKDSLKLLQQGFNIKLEQFKLDLSDEIGDAKTNQVMEIIREITPPVLLKDVSTPSASHDGMAGMDM
jgi:flagellar biosynthesis GTPase FlhF